MQTFTHQKRMACEGLYSLPTTQQCRHMAAIYVVHTYFPVFLHCKLSLFFPLLVFIPRSSDGACVVHNCASTSTTKNDFLIKHSPLLGWCSFGRGPGITPRGIPVFLDSLISPSLPETFTLLGSTILVGWLYKVEYVLEKGGGWGVGGDTGYGRTSA